MLSTKYLELDKVCPLISWQEVEMSTVYNARSLSGNLFSFTVQNKKFKNINRQNKMESHSGATDFDNIKNDVEDYKIIDAMGEIIIPAMIDGHIHSRDPGYTDKEDWARLGKSAFKGGVVAVCDMPNTFPPTMFSEDIIEKAKIASQSELDFLFYVGVSKNNIEKLPSLLINTELPICGAKIYYGQSTGELMYSDLENLAKNLPKPLNKILSFHSEDQCCIDKISSEYSGNFHLNNKEDFRLHSKIRPSKAAHQSTQIILEWAKKYSIPVHIAHLSTPFEVELINKAKEQGVQVTSEVAPHHLIFSEEDYKTYGSLIKMNPPVRSKEEVLELNRHFKNESIEIFATDHAPHLISEKNQLDYKMCPSGVPSIEFFTQLLLTLSDKNGLDIEKAARMGSSLPAQAFGFPDLGSIEENKKASFLWIDKRPYQIEDSDISAKCGWSPYKDYPFDYQVNATFKDGKKVYSKRI